MSQPDQYNPQIPVSNNTIAQSQPQFFTNFNQLFNAFSVDHIALNAASNAGEHNIVRLAEQNQPLTTRVSEVAIYSKAKNQQTTQVFFREQGNQLEYQYSNYQLFNLDPITIGSAKTVVQIPYFSFLPGGIIVYFGQIFPKTGSKTASIILNPPICQTINGINLCIIGPSASNLPFASVVLDGEAKCTSITLTSLSFFPVLATYNYIIFGTST